MTTFEYACPQGHLVVGVNPDRCPECDPLDTGLPTVKVWEQDPYIHYVTQLAHERDLLRGPGASAVQVALLSIHTALAHRREAKEKDDDFERQMLLVNPQMWESVQKRKKEAQESGEGDVVWRRPQSPQEAQEIADELARIEKQLGRERPDPTPTEDDGEWLGASDYAKMRD